MNRTKLIYFLSAFVLIIGCYALNQSYSMFVQTDTINNIDSVVPTLSYSLGDSNLNIEKIVVKANSDELVKIKINNNGTTDIKYVLSLVDKIEGVSVELLKINGNDIIGTLNSNNSKYIWFKIVNTNLEDKEISFSLLATYYTLNINEEIMSRTNIDLENLTDISLKDNIIINAINASIDKTLNNNTIYNDGTILTIDANRGQLLNSEDDYTETSGNNSYYFNGNVIDNHINFANKCWRIVRIEGDSSIKLVLEDIDNICEESNGNYSIPINNLLNINKQETETIITDNSEISEEVNNTSSMNNTTQEILENIEELQYNGTYGYRINENEQVIIDYINSEANEVSMINVFKNFQSELTNYLSYMKAGNWCIDNNIYEEVGKDDNLSYELVNDLNNNYNNWKKMYYDSFVNIKNNQVSLKCNSENTLLDMYVGTLNANEVIFAGIKEKDYISNYLMNSYSLEYIEEENIYSGVNFWTLSPSHFDGLRSYAYGVNSKGNLVSVDLLDKNMTFRPSIILNNINVIEGNGTKNNPYIIIENASVE